MVNLQARRDRASRLLVVDAVRKATPTPSTGDQSVALCIPSAQPYPAVARVAEPELEVADRAPAVVPCEVPKRFSLDTPCSTIAGLGTCRPGAAAAAAASDWRVGPSRTSSGRRVHRPLRGRCREKVCTCASPGPRADRRRAAHSWTRGPLGGTGEKSFRDSCSNPVEAQARLPLVHASPRGPVGGHGEVIGPDQRSGAVLSARRDRGRASQLALQSGKDGSDRALPNRVGTPAGASAANPHAPARSGSGALRRGWRGS